MLVSHKGRYLLIEPSLCCFCPWGAGASVFTAPHPLGPWTKSVTSWNGEWKPCHGYCPNGTNHSAVVPIQPAAAIPFAAVVVGDGDGDGDVEGAPLAAGGAPTEPMWLVTGDRWLSAPNHEKSDDFTVILALSFGEDGGLLNPVWHGGTARDSFKLRIYDSLAQQEPPRLAQTAK